MGGSLANQLFSSIWQKKVWRINRSAYRLLIVITNLDGFSLANHVQFNLDGFSLANHVQFTEFAKLSCYTVLKQV